MTSERRLIITADDFGMARSVNEGVVDALANGCVTATSLLPNGPAFDHAVGLARDHEIDVGIHLGLVQEEPVATPDSVSSLLDDGGRLPEDYRSFLRNYCLGRIDRGDLRRELSAQVKKIMSSDLTVTHIDSHQHLHIVPGILSHVMDLAEDHGIPAVRIPDEQLTGRGSLSVPILGLKTLSKWGKHRLARRDLFHNDTFRGVLQQQAPTPAEIKGFLEGIPNGVAEFGCHLATEEIDDPQRIKKQRDFRGTYEWAVSDDTLGMVEQADVELIGWNQIAGIEDETN